MRPDRLAELMVRFSDLHDGERVFFEVVQAGPDAIPGLRDMVLEPPQPVFAHRCLAVDALAAIGTPQAESVLVEAMEELAARSVPDSLQLAEDAVINRIATRLARSGGAGAADALLVVLAVRPRGEVARALGQLGDLRALPLLIECLDDDLARDGAIEALSFLGHDAAEALTGKLQARDDADGYEASHLVAGRVAAAAILGNIATPESKRALAGALKDPQPPVRSAAAVALVESGGPLREAAIPVLIEALDLQSWLDAVPVIEALVACGRHAVPHLLHALESVPPERIGDRRRERVLEVLARLSPSGAVPAIAHLATGKTPPQTGLAAVSALETIPGPKATQAITAFLGHRSPAVRERAVRGLARRGPAGAAAMARAITDESATVRRAVWEAFASMDPSERAAFRKTVMANGTLRQKIGILLGSIPRLQRRGHPPR